MSETLKTAIFAGVAVVAVVAAWFSGPAASKTETGDQRGQPLVDEFDPLSIGKLQIVEFDKDTATLRPFEVVKAAVKGKTTWAIPSHENYPTDAKDQLSDVAAGLMGLKILDVASNSPGDHARYGVLDPDPKVRKGGDTGVG